MEAVTTAIATTVMKTNRTGTSTGLSLPGNSPASRRITGATTPTSVTAYSASVVRFLPNILETGSTTTNASATPRRPLAANRAIMSAVSSQKYVCM